jgi:hypothetical protein
MNTASHETTPATENFICPTRTHPGFPRLSTRHQANSVGPNHHLFNNNGTWFIHYTLHPDPFTKQRVRASLKTACVLEARRRRDSVLAQLAGGEIILRRFAHLSAA